MRAEFVDMLRCPQSGARLNLGEPELVARVNQAIAGGRLHSRNGRLLTSPIDGLLIPADQARIGYAIVDDIPILVADEAIELP
jgi:uncharacterized protein YbaR (Trm112 family)